METTVTIHGMHCASCAAGIETFLRSQEGVEDATIDYDAETVHIEYTEEAELGELWNRVEEMGYEVER